MILEGKQVFRGKHNGPNVDQFEELTQEYSFIRFFFPNHANAPWHVQAVFGNDVVNFWPHKTKMCVDGERSKQLMDWREAYDELSALSERLPEEDFEVIDAE